MNYEDMEAEEYIEQNHIEQIELVEAMAEVCKWVFVGLAIYGLAKLFG